MKSGKFFKMMAIPALAVVVLSLSYCKKDTETVTETVYQQGVAVSGLVQYPDFTNTQVAAKGAVINLYKGTAATGSPFSTTFADASGKYTLTNLLPGSYFITAKYNTENTNVGKAIDGINFGTNPGYAITVGDVAVTQNISLVAIASTSTLKISLDTVSNPGFRPVTWEIHSKVDFSFPDHATGVELPGGFNTFQVDQFVFDAANPANCKISGYVLLSTVNTNEPVRDALLTGGCVPKTLLINVDSANNIAVPETDTARFTATSVEKYGDGYIAHGNLEAFYHNAPGTSIYPADTNYSVYTGGFAAPTKASVPSQWWDKRVIKPCDLYFVYQGKFAYSMQSPPNQTLPKNMCFIFEGEFVVHPQADYYISSAHFSEGAIKVKTHVQFLGALNDSNYPD